MKDVVAAVPAKNAAADAKDEKPKGDPVVATVAGAIIVAAETAQTRVLALGVTNLSVPPPSAADIEHRDRLAAGQQWGDSNAPLSVPDRGLSKMVNGKGMRSESIQALEFFASEKTQACQFLDMPRKNAAIKMTTFMYNNQLKTALHEKKKDEPEQPKKPSRRRKKSARGKNLKKTRAVDAAVVTKDVGDDAILTESDPSDTEAKEEMDTRRADIRDDMDSAVYSPANFLSTLGYFQQEAFTWTPEDQKVMQKEVNWLLGKYDLRLTLDEFRDSVKSVGAYIVPLICPLACRLIGWAMTQHMGHINHSCDPNAVMHAMVAPDASIYVVLQALREIKPEEEITISYNLPFYWRRQPLTMNDHPLRNTAFVCLCDLCKPDKANTDRADSKADTNKADADKTGNKAGDQTGNQTGDKADVDKAGDQTSNQTGDKADVAGDKADVDRAGGGAMGAMETERKGLTELYAAAMEVYASWSHRTTVRSSSLTIAITKPVFDTLMAVMHSIYVQQQIANVPEWEHIDYLLGLTVSVAFQSFCAINGMGQPDVSSIRTCANTFDNQMQEVVQAVADLCTRSELRERMEGILGGACGPVVQMSVSWQLFVLFAGSLRLSGKKGEFATMLGFLVRGWTKPWDAQTSLYHFVLNSVEASSVVLRNTNAVIIHPDWLLQTVARLLASIVSVDQGILESQLSALTVTAKSAE